MLDILHYIINVSSGLFVVLGVSYLSTLILPPTPPPYPYVPSPRDEAFIKYILIM